VFKALFFRLIGLRNLGDCLGSILGIMWIGLGKIVASVLREFIGVLDFVLRKAVLAVMVKFRRPSISSARKEDRFFLQAE
jgi:hypothetical protein